MEPDEIPKSSNVKDLVQQTLVLHLYHESAKQTDKPNISYFRNFYKLLVNIALLLGFY